jgi:hypothetical protein
MQDFQKESGDESLGQDWEGGEKVAQCFPP